VTTTPTTTAAPAPISRDETGRLFGQTMGLVALTAGVFALGAYIGRDAPGVVGIVCFPNGVATVDLSERFVSGSDWCSS
jgi:hypothetical protein